MGARQTQCDSNELWRAPMLFTRVFIQMYPSNKNLSQNRVSGYTVYQSNLEQKKEK